jgi:integrase
MSEQNEKREEQASLAERSAKEARMSVRTETTPTTPIKPRRKLGTRDGLFQRAGWWWIDYADADGKRHRKKAAPDYQTARLIYRDTVAKIARGEVLGVREEGIRLRDFVERKYWPAVHATLVPEWAARSRDILDRTLLPRFGATKLVGLRREDIEAWYAERLGTVKAGTANKELARLKHLLGRAVEWGYLKDSPARRVKRAKEAPGRVRYLTPEERDTLLNGADETVTANDGRTWVAHHAPSPALRLYILAALHTGARRGELLPLTWAGVDMKARTITFRHTKNGHARTVPMTDTIREALVALPRPLNAEAPVFPERDPKVLSRSFARLVNRLKLANLTFHDLRHDAASTLTMAGVSQRAIMEILGHRDPRMTVRYQHLAPGHLRDAMRALDTRPAFGPRVTTLVAAAEGA